MNFIIIQLRKNDRTFNGSSTCPNARLTENIFKGRVNCFSMQFVMNSFLLNPE